MKAFQQGCIRQLEHAILYGGVGAPGWIFYRRWREANGGCQSEVIIPFWKDHLGNSVMKRWMAWKAWEQTEETRNVSLGWKEHKVKGLQRRELVPCWSEGTCRTPWWLDMELEEGERANFGSMLRVVLLDVTCVHPCDLHSSLHPLHQWTFKLLPS